MEPEFDEEKDEVIDPVKSGEINLWRRGFTPQAEIWNGRMAMIGLALGLSVLLSLRFIF